MTSATVPLMLKLTKLAEGAVPLYDDMVPMVLYKSLNTAFPFCDMVYKETGPEGKLVCIQVSLEANGKRKVQVGAFAKFCERMGWGERPSTRNVARIKYVYCPDPAIADTAQVAFADGVGMHAYTVWHVNKDFSSGT